MFLTGGSGLVGSHVAQALRRGGHHVRALVRSQSDTTFLRTLGCELVTGDVQSSGTVLAGGMSGFDGVVHAAALVGARASRERYTDANVIGTRNVMRAAANAGVARAVHVSSVAVYGPLDGIITEDRWQETPVQSSAVYAASKRAAEEEAWAHHGAVMQVTTVRPSLIFGERDRHVARRIDRAVRASLLPLPDGGRHVLPLVYAGNVARGIVAALESEVAAGRAYNLARDNDAPLADVIAMWAVEAGVTKPGIIPVPGALLEAAAAAIDGLSRIAPWIDLPGVSRPARLSRADNPYDSSRARDELDWRELTPFHEAIARTVSWLRNQRGSKPSRR